MICASSTLAARSMTPHPRHVDFKLSNPKLSLTASFAMCTVHHLSTGISRPLVYNCTLQHHHIRKRKKKSKCVKRLHLVSLQRPHLLPPPPQAQTARADKTPQPPPPTKPTRHAGHTRAPYVPLLSRPDRQAHQAAGGAGAGVFGSAQRKGRRKQKNHDKECSCARGKDDSTRTRGRRRRRRGGARRGGVVVAELCVGGGGARRGAFRGRLSGGRDGRGLAWHGRAWRGLGMDDERIDGCMDGWV
ncbi:hypothetical protein IWZ01DRAFT_29007 [Phyllosticta capitalensis]